MRRDPHLHQLADMYQGWDDERSSGISRVAFLDVLSGYLLGFLSGAAAVLLAVTL